MNGPVSIILYSERNLEVLAEAEERVRQYLERAPNDWELLIPEVSVSESEGFRKAMTASIRKAKNDRCIREDFENPHRRSKVQTIRIWKLPRR